MSKIDRNPVCRYGNRPPESTVIAYRTDSCYRCSFCGFCVCAGCFAEEQKRLADVYYSQHPEEQDEYSIWFFQSAESAASKSVVRTKLPNANNNSNVINVSTSNSNNNNNNNNNNSNNSSYHWQPIAPLEAWPPLTTCTQCCKKPDTLELFPSPPFPWVCESWEGESFRNVYKKVVSSSSSKSSSSAAASTTTTTYELSRKVADGGASNPKAVGNYHHIREEFVRRRNNATVGKIPRLTSCFLGSVFGKAIPREELLEEEINSKEKEDSSSSCIVGGNSNNDAIVVLDDNDNNNNNKNENENNNNNSGENKSNNNNSIHQQQQQEKRVATQKLPTSYVLNPILLGKLDPDSAISGTSRRSREDDEWQHETPFVSTVPPMRAHYFLVKGINSHLCIKSVAASRIHIGSRGACCKEGESFAYFVHNMDGLETELIWFGIRQKAAASSSSSNSNSSENENKNKSKNNNSNNQNNNQNNSTTNVSVAPCREQLEDAVPIARITAPPSSLSSVRPFLLQIPTNCGFVELRLMQGIRKFVPRPLITELTNHTAEAVAATLGGFENVSSADIVGVTQDEQDGETSNTKFVVDSSFASSQQQQQNQNQKSSSSSNYVNYSSSSSKGGGASSTSTNNNNTVVENALGSNTKQSIFTDGTTPETEDDINERVGRLVYSMPPLLTVTILLDTTTATQQQQQQQKQQEQQNEKLKNVSDENSDNKNENQKRNSSSSEGGETDKIREAMFCLLTGSNVGVFGLGSKRHLLSTIARTENLSSFALHVIDGTNFRDATGNSSKLLERGVLNDYVEMLSSRMDYCDNEWLMAMSVREERITKSRVKKLAKIVANGHTKHKESSFLLNQLEILERQEEQERIEVEKLKQQQQQSQDSSSSSSSSSSCFALNSSTTPEAKVFQEDVESNNNNNKSSLFQNPKFAANLVKHFAAASGVEATPSLNFNNNKMFLSSSSSNNNNNNNFSLKNSHNNNNNNNTVNNNNQQFQQKHPLLATPAMRNSFFTQQSQFQSQQNQTQNFCSPEAQVVGKDKNDDVEEKEEEIKEIPILHEELVQGTVGLYPSAMYKEKCRAYLTEMTLENESLTDLIMLNPRYNQDPSLVLSSSSSNNNQNVQVDSSSSSQKNIQERIEALPVLDARLGKVRIGNLSNDSIKKIFGPSPQDAAISFAPELVNNTSTCFSSFLSPKNTSPSSFSPGSSNKFSSSSSPSSSRSTNMMSSSDGFLLSPRNSFLFSSGQRNHQMQQQMQQQQQVLRHLIVVFNIDWIPSHILSQISEVVSTRNSFNNNNNQNSSKNSNKKSSSSSGGGSNNNNSMMMASSTTNSAGRAVILCCFDDAHFLQRAEASFASSLQLKLIEHHTMAPYVVEGAAVSEAFTKLVDNASSFSSQNQNQNDNKKGSNMKDMRKVTNPEEIRIREATERAIASFPPSYKKIIFNLAENQIRIGLDVFVGVNKWCDIAEECGMPTTAARMRQMMLELTSNRLAKYDSGSHSLKFLNPELLVQLLKE